MNVMGRATANEVSRIFYSMKLVRVVSKQLASGSKIRLPTAKHSLLSRITAASTDFLVYKFVPDTLMVATHEISRRNV